MQVCYFPLISHFSIFQQQISLGIILTLLFLWWYFSVSFFFCLLTNFFNLPIYLVTQLKTTPGSLFYLMYCKLILSFYCPCYLSLMSFCPLDKILFSFEYLHTFLKSSGVLCSLKKIPFCRHSFSVPSQITTKRLLFIIKAWPIAYAHFQLALIAKLTYFY